MCMSRAKELAKNTVILTVGKLCTQFVSFLLLPLYTALLSPEEYGTVDLIVTYISLLLPLVCWQYDMGIFRFMLDCRGDRNQIRMLFSSVAVVNVAQVTGFLALFLALRPVVSLAYLEYLAIGVALSVFSGLLMQFARGLGKMLHYSVGSFLTATITVVLNILFVAVLEMGAGGMLLATVCGLLGNCLYLVFALRVWEYFNIHACSWTRIKEVTKYSLPMVPNQISGMVLSTSNRTIISWFLGVGANGIFTVANKFSGLMNTVYGFFDMAWVETVSVHFEDEDRDSFISNMMESALSFFVSACVGVVAVLPFVFSIMVDADYAQAYPHIPILLISVVFRVLMGLYSAVYIALKKSGEIAKTTIIGAVVNVVLHLLLIRPMGLYAASVATAVSFAVVAIERKLDVRKYVKIKSNIWFVVLAVCMVIWTTVSYYVNLLWLNVVTIILAVLYAVYANRKLLWMFAEAIMNKVKK